MESIFPHGNVAQGEFLEVGKTKLRGRVLKAEVAVSEDGCTKGRCKMEHGERQRAGYTER